MLQPRAQGPAIQSASPEARAAALQPLMNPTSPNGSFYEKDLGLQHSILGRGQQRHFSVVSTSGGSRPHLPWELSGAPLLLVPKKIPGDSTGPSPLSPLVSGSHPALCRAFSQS